MLTKLPKTKRRKLSRELLRLIVFDFIFSVAIYFFLRSIAGSLAYEYCEKHQIAMDSLQSITLDYFIFHASIIAAVVVFVALFLLFVGKKLAYIRQLTEGIESLRTHSMNHEIPLEGNNELTELAESINYLAETERHLKQIQRNLSHDVRTPLTAILSYTEYMQSREDLSAEELSEFLEMTHRKAQQMKQLTERMMDGGVQLTEIEDGRLLMAQLAEEWEEILETDFDCHIDIDRCPQFSGQYDLEELRRVFDNLASNVAKYADERMPVSLTIMEENGRIVIGQSNGKPEQAREVESRKIGLTSIETIAKHYGGNVIVEDTATTFAINIILFEV